jgi:hypothetical protein
MNYVILTPREYTNLKKTNSFLSTCIDYAIFNEQFITENHWIVYFNTKISYTTLISLFTIK